MKLKIITHERIVFDGEVDELVIQTTGGQLGILKDHIPLTTALEIGVTKAKVGDKYKYFATMGGIFQFKNNEATILTDVCEDGCDIDVTRANAAKDRAEARLADNNAKITKDLNEDEHIIINLKEIINNKDNQIENLNKKLESTISNFNLTLEETINRYESCIKHLNDDIETWKQRYLKINNTTLDGTIITKYGKVLHENEGEENNE